MNYRQFILLLLSLLSVIIFFQLQGNKKWLDERILNFTEHITDELDMMSLEERREYRLGPGYVASMAVPGTIASWDIKDPVVLLPPTDYVKAQGIDASFPEPIVFYYYTGLKSVQPNSSNVLQANVGLLVDPNNQMLTVVKLDSEEKIKAVLQEYKTPHR